MTQLETIARFNYMDLQDGSVISQDVQYRTRIRARLDIPTKWKTYFTTRAETGKGFDNSWNNAGLGVSSNPWIFNVKTLTLHQPLRQGIEFQAGGLEFDPGAGTNSTYASGDGAFTGYRLVLDKKTSGLLDKLSVTAGYVGSFDHPNVFSRFRMDRVNYIQALAQHRLSDGIEASAQFDWLSGVPYTRAALRRSKFSILDDTTIEAIGRLRDGVSLGWAIGTGHNLSSRWAVTALYSSMPRNLFVIDGKQALLNRGEIAVGKRLSAGSSFRPNSRIEIGVFGGRLLDTTPTKRWVAQVSVGVQYADLANELLQVLSRRQ